MTGDVLCGKAGRSGAGVVCGKKLQDGRRPMRHHRPGFVADREHDALIELRCSWPTCRAVYLVPYDDLVACQREGSLIGADALAVRSPGQTVARLVPKAQRGSQGRARATSSVGATPQPR